MGTCEWCVVSSEWSVQLTTHYSHGLLASHLLRLLRRLFDRTDIHERAFRQVVPLAVAEFLEAADRLGQRGDITRLAGKRLRDDERLRQESLDPPGSRHDLPVLFAQFLDAENRNDVLQLAVSLQDRLHAAGDREVPFADEL